MYKNKIMLRAVVVIGTPECETSSGDKGGVIPDTYTVPAVAAAWQAINKHQHLTGPNTFHISDFQPLMVF